MSKVKRIDSAPTSTGATPPAPSAPAPSAPTPPFGAPSLGQPDRIYFPIHADRAFGEGPTGGAA